MKYSGKTDNENVACPFCEQIVKAKKLKNLTLREIMARVLPILEVQGFEIRKIRKRKNKLITIK